MKKALKKEDKMKPYLHILTLILFCFFNEDDNQLGKYSYSTSHFYESIELRKNNRFVYTMNQEFIRYEIRGNYFLHGDSLTLDSNPQRDKIIVTEKRSASKNNNLIIVRDKSGEFITYHIYLILLDGELICLRDQWGKSKIKNKTIRGFYLVDTKGLKSPTYIKKGEFSNHFEVQFETERVFENETWYLEKNKIKPIGMNGEFQKYYLEKAK